jgi:hypothetical protein
MQDISFDDLIAPMPRAQFMDQVFDLTWVHISARDRDRFSELMSWPDLNGLLNLNVWTERTLGMVMDKSPIPAAAFCTSSADRNHNTVMRPDPIRVMDLCKAGASLVLNEIESLHPGIRHIANILQQTLGARVSANLYCSWAARQAFDAHYDRHDVFALHVIGQKNWHIYQGRAEQPLEHALFHNIPQADYDRQKGPIAGEITLQPGDLLYLPRGQFHDALAEAGPSVHLTFSCNAPNGLDWLNLLYEQAAQDPEFRKNLPFPMQNADTSNSSSDGDPLGRHLANLSNRFETMAREPGFIERLRGMRQFFGADLPPYRIMSEDEDNNT